MQNSEDAQAVLLTIMVGILIGSISNLVAHWLALARDKRKEALGHEDAHPCEDDTREPAA